MPHPDTLITLIVLGIGFFLIPGPAVLYVIAQTTEGGWTRGAVASLGLFLAALCHVAAASAGVASVLLSLPEALELLRWSGGAILAALAINAWRRAGQSTRKAPSGSVLWPSFWVNLLNPKALAFYFAVVPQFVDPATGDTGRQILLIGAVLAGLGLLCDLAWVAVSAVAGALVTGTQRARTTLQRAGAVTLFLLAVAAVASGERSRS